jgi:uncharacterized RDD family membrane protein YckC
MRAWRLKVERSDGRALGWKTGCLRFAAACISLLPLGLGFFWLIVDPQKRTAYDRFSGTRVVVLPKRKKTRGSAGT